MDLTRLTGGLTRGVEDTLSDIGDVFREPVIRLGVTGLSRAGKTVFITSLVANLLDRGRMPQLRAAAEGRILAAYLQPQPDHTIPRFAYEDHLDALTGPEPHWPESTRSISTLRLSLRVAPTGFIGGLTGPRIVHLDIVDYPGEWLLDLPLMNQDFEDWSAAAIATARTPARAPHAAAWLAQLEATDPAAAARRARPPARLAAAFTAYLAAARAAGLSSVAPGRFLMPGDLEGSPALTFSPLHEPERAPRPRSGAPSSSASRPTSASWSSPFFRNHFARLDRQVVLMDALGAIHDGPRAVEDLRAAMAEILACFRPGPRSWLAPILGRRIDRILFAATKADYLHHTQHAASPPSPRRWSTTPAPARSSPAPRPARCRSPACAPPSRQTVTRDGREVDVVRGRLIDTGEEAALFPGDLPDDPARDPRPGPPGRRRLDRRRLPRHPLRAAAAAARVRRRPAAHPPRPRRRVPDRRPPVSRAADDPFVIPADELAPGDRHPRRRPAAARRRAARGRGDAGR